MKYPVLVLNNSFEPYDVWGWQKTMCKLLSTTSVRPVYDEKNQIIKHNKLIRDGKGNIYELPQIIVLNNYIPSKHNRACYSKINIYARDLGCCQYCGKSIDYNQKTIDHVIPKQYFNPKRYNFSLHSFFNVVTCCQRCNFQKRNLTPHKAGMKLIKKPTWPTRLQVYKNKLSLLTKIPESWKTYL
jgi:5-methylcytosine-specific restriction endonuclease McrA